MKASFEILAKETVLWDGNPEVALRWIAERLTQLGLASDVVVTVRAKKSTLAISVFDERYKLSGLVSDALPNGMTLGLHKPQALLDHLLGRSPFDGSDPFARVLQEMLEREAALVEANVEVMWR